MTIEEERKFFRSLKKPNPYEDLSKEELQRKLQAAECVNIALSHKESELRELVKAIRTIQRICDDVDGEDDLR